MSVGSADPSPALDGLVPDSCPFVPDPAKNSVVDARYKGPCPPGDDDPHRYGFTDALSSSPPPTEPAQATR
jgi:hypothetical protein